MSKIQLPETRCREAYADIALSREDEAYNECNYDKEDAVKPALWFYSTSPGVNQLKDNLESAHTVTTCLRRKKKLRRKREHMPMFISKLSSA